MDLSGYYYIDGMDLWTTFNIFVEEGSDDFLKYPAKKKSIEHDWMDAHGVDHDLSRVFFQPRDITLRCAIIVNTQQEFFDKYQSFISVLTQPNTRSITVEEFGQSFHVFYKECINFTRLTRLKDQFNNGQIGCKFSLVLTEQKPKVVNAIQALADEAGRIIVT